MCKKKIGLLLLLLLPQLVAARAVVLIQGFHGYGHEWRDSGVAHVLLANGWADGGHLFDTPLSPFQIGVTGREDQLLGDNFYTLSLPSEAPLLVQLTPLVQTVARIAKRHEGEPLVLVGHSVGGLLARLLVIYHPEIKVAAVVTIATPHLGAALAEVGEFVGDTPLGMMAPMFGADSVNRANRLLGEIGREEPGMLLFWLNRQPHPALRYISLIHMSDSVVARYSQDMNQVPALAGRAETLTTYGGHSLNISDGHLLAGILATIN
ncbi:MAG: alpha/beta hydrolase [Gammaproteobacteria bacterium]|nr:alpha/beta hydrolase [Gammaproteobacteria bacterium]